MEGVVRPEYEELARDFGALVAHFDLAIDPPLERDLFLVAASFETIDRHIDAEARAADRGAMADAILRHLRGEAVAGPTAPELAARLRALRARLLAQSGVEPFCAAAARFFAHTESLRTTTRTAAFVEHVLVEAQCATEMTLVVAARLRAPGFARFFGILAEVANLVDKLHDVRGDRRRGEAAVRTGIVLHARLAIAFVARVAILVWLSPRPVRLLAWGARYLLPPPRTTCEPRAAPAPSARRTSR